MSITISPSMVNIEESIGLRYVYDVTSDIVVISASS